MKAQRPGITVLAWEHRMASDIWKGRPSQAEKEKWLNEVGPRPGRALCAKKLNLDSLLRRIRSHQKGWASLGSGAVDTSQVKPGRSPMVGFFTARWCQPLCLPILSASQDALHFKIMSIGTKSKDLEPGKDGSLPQTCLFL